MQCIQPFCATGFPTFGQFYNYNQVMPYSNIYPEIIGEGEVISWVTPDGTVQFFFVPTSPYPYNPPKYYPEWNNTNKYAWYIRNYPKQASIPLFTGQLIQKLPETYWLPHSNSYDCNIQNAQYKLKFHNDGWSSTTDLHYFIPRPRPCDLYIPQKCNAITQIDIPVATNTYHYKFFCDKPCNCPPQGFKNNEEITQCCCGNKGQVSPMAVDTNSDEPTHCVANIVPVKDALKTSHGDTKTKSDVRCECKEEKRYSNNDKLVTTFAEQGSGCVADVSCDTQCCDHPEENTAIKHKVFKLNPVKQEIWQPITPLSKKAMKSKSSENVVIKSDNNTGSCSCSENGF